MAIECDSVTAETRRSLRFLFVGTDARHRPPQHPQIAALAQTIEVEHSLFVVNSSGLLVKPRTFHVFKVFMPHHASGAR